MSEISTQLHLLGFKKSSTTSLISQLVRDNQLRRDANKLYAVTNEYRPLSSGSRKKTLKAKRITTVEVETPKEPPKTEQQDPQEIVKHLNVYQARKLYDHLRCMFGS